jgi:competence protein ComEA
MVIAHKHSTLPEFIRLRQKGLFIFSILILLFLGFRFWVMHQKPIPPAKKGGGPALTIELEGKVQRPGLYVFSAAPTIYKVIRVGGGLLGDQALSESDGKVLLMQDGTLRVDTERDGKPFIQQTSLSVKTLWILGRPIPLNRAEAEDLDRLPGIGPGLAQRIIDYRQGMGSFSSLDQLKKINGIKEKTFEKIKRYLTL